MSGQTADKPKGGYAHLWQFDKDKYMKIQLSEETPTEFSGRIDTGFGHTYYGGVRLTESNYVGLLPLNDADTIENIYRRAPRVKNLVDMLMAESRLGTNVEVVRPVNFGLCMQGDPETLLKILRRYGPLE